MKITIYLKTIRLKNIVKNITIFFPILFSGEVITNFNLQIILDLLKVSLSFFFISGLVYIFNDLEDKLEDEKHPVKKFRPIAAGLVTKNEIKLIWTQIIHKSPSKAGRTASITSSLNKKDFSGFTISILNCSLITLLFLSPFYLLFL